MEDDIKEIKADIKILIKNQHDYHVEQVKIKKDVDLHNSIWKRLMITIIGLGAYVFRSKWL